MINNLLDMRLNCLQNSSVVFVVLVVDEFCHEQLTPGHEYKLPYSATSRRVECILGMF